VRGRDGREIKQVIAHGNAWTSQRVVEVIVRTPAKAAKELFVIA